MSVDTVGVKLCLSCGIRNEINRIVCSECAGTRFSDQLTVEENRDCDMFLISDRVYHFDNILRDKNLCGNKSADVGKCRICLIKKSCTKKSKTQR